MELEICFYLRGTNQIDAGCEVLCISLVAQRLQLEDDESQGFITREIKRHEAQYQQSYHIVPKSTGHECVGPLAQVETVRSKVRAVGPAVL